MIILQLCSSLIKIVQTIAVTFGWNNWDVALPHILYDFV